MTREPPTRSARADEDFTDFAMASRARLRRTAYLLCGDWDRASDHVQDGLIKVYANWSRIERRGSELAYARRAVVSACLDALRRSSSREVVTGLDVTGASENDVAAAVADRVALLDALSRLPPRQRACVVLRYFEDLDVRQTAAALGCREGTVKSQTARGLTALRRLLESEPVDEPVDELVTHATIRPHRPHRPRRHP